MSRSTHYRSFRSRLRNDL